MPTTCACADQPPRVTLFPLPLTAGALRVTSLTLSDIATRAGTLSVCSVEFNVFVLCSYRRMNLQMWRDYDAIQHDVVITTSDGPVEYDHERAYKGYVEGM